MVVVRVLWLYHHKSAIGWYRMYKAAYNYNCVYYQLSYQSQGVYVNHTTGPSVCTVYVYPWQMSI